jgi:hypothetical protein
VKTSTTEKNGLPFEKGTKKWGGKNLLHATNKFVSNDCNEMNIVFWETKDSFTTKGVNFNKKFYLNISPNFFALFLWPMIFGKQRTNLVKLISQIWHFGLGEIEWQIFRQTLVAGIFSLGTKVWWNSKLKALSLNKAESLDVGSKSRII